MPKQLKVTPLSQIDRRVPEAGRIRMGHKVTARNGKQSMAALDTFRFTSPRRELLDQLARIHGGEVKPWHDAKANPAHQFQLYSDTDSIEVLVIPQGISVWYEMWTGGGCKRRCDGEICTVPKQTSQYDFELIEQPCLCDAEGALSCKTYTRINIVLPEISFAGSWRLESHGENASKELPGMYEFIEQVQARGGMPRATLSIDKREHMTEVGKRNFVVPKLALIETPNELIAGTTATAIAGPSAPLQLTPKSSAWEADRQPGMDSGDDEPVDAEVLTPELIAAEVLLEADALNFGFDPRAYVEAVKTQVAGDVERMRSCSDKVRAGVLEPLSLSGGIIQWRRSES